MSAKTIAKTLLTLAVLLTTACAPRVSNRGPASEAVPQVQDVQNSTNQSDVSIYCSGPRVLVLNNGVEAGQARIDMIQKAQFSITAQYFIYYDDETSLVSLKLLRDAARRGVKVRIIVDAQFNGIPKALRHYLQLEGIEIKEFHPLRLNHLNWTLRRMHDKVLIVDGQEMITGGRNIQNDYYDVPGAYQYRDRDAYVVGRDVVGQASQYFEELWASKEVRISSKGDFTDDWMKSDCNRWSDRNAREMCERKKAFVLKAYAKWIQEMEESDKFLDGSKGFVYNSQRDWVHEAKPIGSARFVHDIPGGKASNTGMGPEILSLLNSAKKSILIESPYLVPDKEELDALRAAVVRGVDVRILTNSTYSGDNTLVLVSYYKSEQKEVLATGTKIWEYKGPESIHGKTIVIDDAVTFIGSANFDRMSFKLNMEVGVIFDDAETSFVTSQDIRLRMASAWEIGQDGKPLNMDPGLSYPWKKGKSTITRRILSVLRFLYKPYL